MMEEELIRIWQSSPNQERINFEKSRLMLEVQSNIDRLDKMIKYRDIRELAGVVVVIPLFIFLGYKSPFVISKIGAGCIILWAIYGVVRLLNARKHKPGLFSGTYLEYLRKTKEYLQAQAHMLDTVLYWYILPCHIGLTLMFLGPLLGVGKLYTFIKAEVLTAIVGIVIYILNKRAVNKTLLPRLEKIDDLIKAMEN
jgi:hypothetical protein